MNAEGPSAAQNGGSARGYPGRFSLLTVMLSMDRVRG